MGKMMTIARFELKMQLKNIGFWLLLAFGLVIALLDNFPSQANLERLKSLVNQGYVVSRLLLQPGLVLMFGYMFLVSGRIINDVKNSISELFMASPISKKQYILGKFLGNYLVCLLSMGIYLAINAFFQILFNPAPFSLLPYIVGFIVIVLPATFFVVGCSIAISAMLDIRLFYAVFSAYFLYNLIIVPKDHIRPFYMLFGEMVKVVFSYSFGISYQSLFLNLAYLCGVGSLPLILLLWNKRFWREA